MSVAGWWGGGVVGWRFLVRTCLKPSECVMKFTTVHRRLVLSLIACAFFMVACAGFQQAYDERIQWVPGEMLPVQKTELFMSLQSPPDLPFTDLPLIPTPKIIAVRPMTGLASPKIGELFSHYGSIPIYNKGPSPWQTLGNDVTQIMRRSGYQIHDDLADPAAPAHIIETDMTLLDVRSEPGGWLDLQGTTRGVAAFRMTLLSGSGEELWSREFRGQHEIKVSYSLLRDSEKTLAQAYAKALDYFARAVRSDEFFSLVQ